MELRSGLRRFVFPVSLFFFVWHLAYVVLAAYEADFMSHRVFGSVNVGLLLGVLQFASTLAITLWYRRFARRWIDPQAEAISAANSQRFRQRDVDLRQPGLRLLPVEQSRNRVHPGVLRARFPRHRPEPT